ncbi:MAG: four helix bundle protein [Salinivirgaceae bacterium]|nr:four helix bundle protein [Salinivirgaceae bacterium]MBR5167312.1 four helix bundle protein [Salinivirgaceae bacterium]
MGANVLKEKSFQFSIKMVDLYKHLTEEKKEFILSKQLLRSGTSIGAMVRESEYSESKSDFIHKLAIAQKETNESLYWIELLGRTDFIDIQTQNDLMNDATELLRIITASIKTVKESLAKKLENISDNQSIN